MGAGRVVVVGGGAAGASVVRTLVRSGYDDEIVLLCGEAVAPYDRTVLSKEGLLDADAPSRPLLKDDTTGAVDVRIDARVKALDRNDQRVRLADGQAIAYDHLVLATGAEPRRLDLPGADLDVVHTLREVDRWTPLREAVLSGGRLVIIGGGLIGLEVAAAARSHGGDVVVVEVADRLMGRVLPAPVAEAVADEHTAHGVRLELGARPTAVVPDGQGAPAGVLLADGRLLPADAVLISVGARPRVALAEAAGLPVDDGVIVDGHLRTADPRVLAAGDIVRIATADGTLGPRTEAWTPAVAMGQHAARTLLGERTPFTDVPWMWSDQYELRVQAAGNGVEDLEQVTRGALNDPGGLVLFGLAGGRVRSVAGVSRGTGVGRTIRVGQLLIQHGVDVDAEALADPTTDLRRLIPQR